MIAGSAVSPSRKDVGWWVCPDPLTTMRPLRLDDAGIVSRMLTIGDEFEANGYRRVGAELRHQGIVINHKKIRRLMREQISSPSAGAAKWPRPTAITTARSFPIAPIIG